MREKSKVIVNNGQWGFMFFVAYIGAAVYFIQQSHGFWEVVGALFKAIVWPGFIVYHVLQLLHT